MIRLMDDFGWVLKLSFVFFLESFWCEMGGVKIENKKVEIREILMEVIWSKIDHIVYF